MTSASRRQFLCAAAVVATGVAHAQPGDRLPVVGIVADFPQVAVIRDGLRKRGWVDGNTVRILWKEPKGQLDLAQGIIEEFVRVPVSVMVVFTDAAALVAVRITKVIPMVMLTTGAVVEDGLVASLGRPDRNLTGLSFEAPREITGKGLALLKAMAPRVRRVGYLIETIGPRGASEHETRATARETREAAVSLDMQLHPLFFGSSAPELDRALKEALDLGVDGLLVSEGVLITQAEHQKRIHEVAHRHRLAVLHSVLTGVDTGGLMGYGLNFEAFIRRVPYFVDRILRGARPADLPIEQPSTLELVVNRSAARAIGLTLPQSLLVQATRVIE